MPCQGPNGPAASPRTSRPRIRWGWRAAYVALLLSLTLALQAAVVVAGLSDEEVANQWIAGAAAGALAASWVMMSGVESRSPVALGLLPGRRAIRDFASGAGVGSLLVVVVRLTMFGADWIEWSWPARFSGSWMLRALEVTMVLLLAAFAEEVAVRGYPFRLLAANVGPIGATSLSAAVFASLHVMNPGVGWLALGDTFLAGILLGIMYWKTLSLWLVTGAHFAWNWTMGVGAGLPVSGLELDGEGVRARIAGPSSLTGGSYGPEGGWLLTLVTLAGIVWMAHTPRLSRDPALVALGPLPCGPVRTPPWASRELGSLEPESEDR